MLRKILIATLILSFFALAGCSSLQEKAAAELGIMEVKAAELPKGDADASLIKSNNEFGKKLLQQMGSEWTGAYSPVSLAMALQMTMIGADETARAAMEKALGTELGQSDIDVSNGRLLDAWNGSKGVSVVNAVFANKDRAVKDEFAQQAADYYRASVGSLDFSDKESTLKTINEWVSGNTSGRIPELLSNLDPSAQMLLLNALDMDLTWERKFKSEKTFEGDFIGLKGTQKAEFMSDDGEFAYAEALGGQIVLLPYEGGEYYMTVYLPGENESPADFMNKVEFSRDMLSNRFGTLYLPKVDLTTQFGVNDALKAMGMGDAFMDGKGNFPGLFELSTDEYARISNVVHAARLTVDEEGTKASAATSVEVSVTGIMMPPDDAFEMRCDRPYAMQIIHADTGAVMFTAVVNDLNG